MLGAYSYTPVQENFLVNLLAGLTAYTYQEKKPGLDLLGAYSYTPVQGLPALPPAIF